MVKTIGAGKKAEDGEERVEGMKYEVYMYMPPMPEAPEEQSEGEPEWDGKPKIEYHYADEDDDESA